MIPWEAESEDRLWGGTSPAAFPVWHLQLGTVRSLRRREEGEDIKLLTRLFPLGSARRRLGGQRRHLSCLQSHLAHRNSAVSISSVQSDSSLCAWVSHARSVWKGERVFVCVKDVSPESAACRLELTEPCRALPQMLWGLDALKPGNRCLLCVWHGMWAHASEWD